MNIQQEIRVLNSAAGLVESIVNYSICNFPEDRSKIVKTVQPENYAAQRYFFILLLEIIAGVNREIIPDKTDGDNLLKLIIRISKSPQLNQDDPFITSMESAANSFQDWLGTEFQYPIYSANIGKNITIKLTRKDALYLIGNKCKHTLTRSNKLLQKLVNIYKNSGVSIEPSQELLILDDIDTWLLDDFGNYHFTQICELCSNLYYGIFAYIQPEMMRRTVHGDEGFYSYDPPSGISGEDGMYELYELFNRFRSPWIPRIKTWDSLLKKY